MAKIKRFIPLDITENELEQESDKLTDLENKILEIRVQMFVNLLDRVLERENLSKLHVGVSEDSDDQGGSITVFSLYASKKIETEDEAEEFGKEIGDEYDLEYEDVENSDYYQTIQQYFYNMSKGDQDMAEGTFSKESKVEYSSRLMGEEVYNNYINTASADLDKRTLEGSMKEPTQKIKTNKI